MCCLSEASSHFVVFVCVNPGRKPSRKMKRRNEVGTHGSCVRGRFNASIRALRQAQGPNGSDFRFLTFDF